MKKLTLLQLIIIELTIFLVISFFSSCKKNNSNPVPPVSITAININHGPFGTVVVIMGTDFDAIPTNDKIYFTGKPAPTENYPTTTQITAFVPVGAGTGNVCPSLLMDE